MGKTILLVEDDPIARKAMERLILNDPRLASIEPREARVRRRSDLGAEQRLGQT